MSGFCSLAFRNLPVEEALSAISDSGFQEVEIGYPHVRDRSDVEMGPLRHTAQECDIVFMVSSPSFSFTQGKDRARESMCAAVDILKTARPLGIRKIRAFVNVGSHGLASEKAEDSDWKAAEDGFRELCGMDRSMEFVLETHENTLANTLPSVQRLLAEVDQPKFKLNSGTASAEYCWPDPDLQRAASAARFLGKINL